MTKIALSDALLRSITPSVGQRCYWDTKLPAFGVRVSQGGSKTFVLNRANSLITIGRFPILTLAEARAEAKRLLAEFTLGKSRPQPTTYSQAVELFLSDKKKSRRAITVQSYERLLKRLRFTNPVANITHAEAAHQLARIKRPSQYNHALVALRIFFNWTIKRRMRSDNPTFGLSTNATVSRSRVLSDEELKKVWEASDQCGQFGTIVKLLILTGQRRTEIASLQSSWLRDDSLTLPAQITKNKRDHTVPLALMARQLLPPKDGLLFPARGRNVPFNGWSKGKTALDKLSGVTTWTLHDLRRTFATHIAGLGVAPHVIERLLNHATGAISGVAAIYNRYSFMDEMRAAIVLWEKRLRALIALQHAA
jgi:integrase